MAPISYELEWNEDDVQRFLELAKEVFVVATRLFATEVWGNIMREAPTDQGKLAGNWTLNQIDDFEWTITTNTEYARFVHDGTGVFGPSGTRIEPVNARALAFVYQGRTVIVRSIAGQQPNPFADRAVEMAEQRKDEFIQMALAETGAA